jgi:hypothetical protein
MTYLLVTIDTKVRCQAMLPPESPLLLNTSCIGTIVSNQWPEIKFPLGAPRNLTSYDFDLDDNEYHH